MYLGSIEVLWVARYDYQPRKVLNAHRHNYWQLFYIVDGKGEFNTDQQSYPIEPDMTFLIKPNQLHGLSVEETDTVQTIEVKFHIYDHLMQDFVSSLDPIICTKIAGLKSLFDKVHAEGVRQPLFYQELSRVYLWEIIVLIVREIGNGAAKVLEQEGAGSEVLDDPISQQVKAYISENHNQDISLKDISEALGYHQGYLCSIFKKANGYTIMQYLYRYRIDKAKELILYSDYSLKEIAFKVGFKSIHHFTRLFHELQGLTPGAFRKKERDLIGKDIYFDENFVNIS